MEEHLPFIVAENPDRGVQRSGVRCRDMVRRQRGVLTESRHIEVAHRGYAGRRRQQYVRELVHIEDPPGRTELFELRSKEIGDFAAICLLFGVQQPFFQSMEVFLKLSLGHDDYWTIESRG